MEALIIVVIVAVLLFNFGAVVGAGIQDRIWEDQRRRLAKRRRELNAKVRELREQGYYVTYSAATDPRQAIEHSQRHQAGGL